MNKNHMPVQKTLLAATALGLAAAAQAAEGRFDPGGALLYTQYGFIKRHLMKKIAQDNGGQFKLVKQSPLVPLKPELGSRPVFTLTDPLKVRKNVDANRFEAIG